MRYSRQVSSTRNGINPILVAVNRPDYRSEMQSLTPAHKLACFDLLTQFHPKALRVRIMKVDEFAEKEYYPSAPENWTSVSVLEPTFRSLRTNQQENHKSQR